MHAFGRARAFIRVRVCGLCARAPVLSPVKPLSVACDDTPASWRRYLLVCSAGLRARFLVSKNMASRSCESWAGMSCEHARGWWQRVCARVKKKG